MNRKKQKLIEIFFITFFFFIFIILFQLQSFVIVILLVASLTISLCFKNDIMEIILPKKKHFLYFIFFDIFLIISMIKLFGDEFDVDNDGRIIIRVNGNREKFDFGSVRLL